MWGGGVEPTRLVFLPTHPEVEPWWGGRKCIQTQTNTFVSSLGGKSNRDLATLKETTSSEAQSQPAVQMAQVPTVSVRLVQSL